MDGEKFDGFLEQMAHHSLKLVQGLCLQYVGGDYAACCDCNIRKCDRDGFVARRIVLLRLLGHLAGFGHNLRLCNGQVDVGLVVVRTEATHSEIDGAFLVEFDEACM